MNIGSNENADAAKMIEQLRLELERCRRELDERNERIWETRIGPSCSCIPRSK